MNFNKEQWYSVIRYVVVFGGGLLVAKGVLPKDFDLSKVTESIIAIVGAISSIAALVQSITSKTDKNLIKAAAPAIVKSPDLDIVPVTAKGAEIISVAKEEVKS